MTYVDTLSSELVKLGIEPCIITAGNCCKEERDFCEEQGFKLVEGNVLPPYGVKLPLPERLKSKRRIRLFMRKCLADLERFDAIHVHTSHPWFLYMTMQESKRAGIEMRITHSHGELPAESFPFNLTHAYYANEIGRLATHILACSAPAGRYTYGKRLWEQRGEMARNGVNTSVFFPSNELRSGVRGETDSFVLGNVARLSAEKNHLFLLTVFEEVVRQSPDAVLWLVGDGPMREDLERRARELGLADRIVFWGQRDDVPVLLQGMDVMVFPSIREGMPFSLVEAQAVGLPCVVSDTVSTEVDVPGCPIVHLSLQETAESWAHEILSYQGKRILQTTTLIREGGFDLSCCAREMAARYQSEISKKI